MNYRKSKFIIAVAILGAPVGSAARGAPAGPAYCFQYAQQAVVDHEENWRLKCGFADWSWRSDLPWHYYWCLKVDKSVADAQTRARKKSLAQCEEDADAEMPPLILHDFPPLKPTRHLRKQDYQLLP